MNLRALRILLWKEVLMLKRNPFIPRLIVAMPIMVMLVMPLIANLDVKNVGITVVDNDHTQLSRRIVADLGASEYINVRDVVTTYGEALEEVKRGDADAVMVIPADYSRDLVNGQMPKLEIDANGVNSTKGMLGAQYAARSAMATVSLWRGIDTSATEVSTLNYFNETLNFKNYMIPALMTVLIIIICGFLPTLNLVSEKETGTIEAMNVTPVSRLAFVLSKLIPYWIVGLLVVTIGMLIGWAVYGLVPAGNILLIYFAAVLFSLVMSGLGVAIANKSATMIQSVFVMFAFIMIFQLMGGLFTPISSMPLWAQTVTYVVPPRYFIEIMRSVYLKGSTLADLWPQFAALGGIALILNTLAALTYSKRN